MNEPRTLFLTEVETEDGTAKLAALQDPESGRVVLGVEIGDVAVTARPGGATTPPALESDFY